MFCERHPEMRLQEVCGSKSCGLCYEESLSVGRHPRPPRATSAEVEAAFKDHGKFGGYGNKGR